MEPVAIIGMDCIFPGAPDLASYWHNIQQGVDAISEVPEHRWSKAFFDPDSAEVDRFYCRRGGFIDEYADFDPIQFGIMPNAVAGVEHGRDGRNDDRLDDCTSGRSRMPDFRRCSDFMLQSRSMNSAASQSSSAGCDGGLPLRPKSKTLGTSA